MNHLGRLEEKTFWLRQNRFSQRPLYVLLNKFMDSSHVRRIFAFYASFSCLMRKSTMDKKCQDLIDNPNESCKSHFPTLSFYTLSNKKVLLSFNAHYFLMKSLFLFIKWKKWTPNKFSQIKLKTYCTKYNPFGNSSDETPLEVCRFSNWIKTKKNLNLLNSIAICCNYTVANARIETGALLWWSRHIEQRPIFLIT